MANFFLLKAKRVCIMLLRFFEALKQTTSACGNQIPSDLIFLTVSERSHKAIYVSTNIKLQLSNGRLFPCLHSLI